jgi:tetratricopeptide (TPR) repeat protein
VIADDNRGSSVHSPAALRMAKIRLSGDKGLFSHGGRKMRLAAFKSVFAYVVLSIMLSGCVRSLQCPALKPLEASGTADPVPYGEEKPAGVVASLSGCPFDPAEAKRTVNQYGTELQQNGGGRDITLVELARLCFMLGKFGKKSESELYFNRGRYYAECLSKEQPARVEGHYWLAMNLAGLAEVGGAGRALRLLPVIVDELEVALGIDETYDQGGPHRVLGRIRCEAPSWPLSEGNIDQSLEHLRSAVRVSPESSTNHLYLAETLYQLGRTEEAFRELDRVIATSCYATYPADVRKDCEEALRLLKK